MPNRIQGLIYALGSAKQVDIATISPSFNRWRKLDADVATLRYNTETDKDEIGKGNEFISQVFPTYWDVQGGCRKYSSAEWTLWAWAYALGKVQLSSSLYTIHAIEPGTTVELPYFSLVQQLAEGGGTAIDEAMIGLAIQSVTTSFRYGPGRQSSETSVSFMGSGRHVFPSAVTAPAVLPERNLLSSSMAITINGVDYVAGSPGAKSILMGEMTWNNNLIEALRFFPGSGTDTGAAVGGRTFIGNRAPGLSFTAFLQADSTELAKVIAQTTGTAVITLTYDATHYVIWTWNNVSFELVDRVTEEGFVCVRVTVAPRYDPTVVSSLPNGVVIVTGKCGITDIAQ